MDTGNRIYSIDIMRGLTIFLMLFVNDLNMDVAPAWLGNMEADFDGMGLADWVLPGFLFIAGMVIPFSFSERISRGLTLAENSRHILTRTISLLVIGILILNIPRVDAGLTGISRSLWALLMYIAVFLIWNNYKYKDNKPFTVTGFRLAGIGILILLVFKFKSGQPENDGSLITGSWGALGMIGWGYLVSAFTFLLCRNSILKTCAFAILFLSLNILSGLKLLEFLNPVKSFIGVIIDGSAPFIVLTGLIAGLIVKKSADIGQKTVILNLILAGILCFAAGFILHRWFIISRIQTSPTWGLFCCGISIFAFIVIYLLTEVLKKEKLASFFKPAGENSLATYLAPGFLYQLILMTGLPVLFYKQSANPLIVVGGSVILAVLMLWLPSLFRRLGIQLKL